VQRKIKNAVLKLKIKQIIKKLRTYFGYGYLVAYVWIGFAIFALIENDTGVILWAFVPLILSMFFYSKTTKSRKTLTSLKNAEIQPDFEALQKCSNQLEKSSEDYFHRIKVIMLILDFERGISTKTEGQIMLICMFSYIFGLFIYVRNFPATNEVYKGLGIFLTTFGIVVVSGLFLLYFRFIKRASEFFVRYHISGFVKKNCNHARNMLAVLDVYQNPDAHLNEEAAKSVSTGLSKFNKRLTEIEDSLKGHKRSITISLASILGYIASLITFLYNIYPQFQSGSLQMLSIYGFIILYAVLGSIFVFYFAPLSRMRNLLTSFKVIQNEEKMTSDIRNMMSSSLGREISEVALESLHIAG
jgi:hypothetical protein